MNQISLTIFVSQMNNQSQQVIENLRQALMESYEDKFELDIINVLDMPEKAIQEGVFVTPTLVRSFPSPVVKVLGDLSDSRAILTRVDIRSENDGDTSTLLI